MSTLIKVRHVYKSYTAPLSRHGFSFVFKSKNAATQSCLQNISWEIESRKCILLEGANGSGKSTLLNVLSGIYLPTSGYIEQRGLVVPINSCSPGMYWAMNAKENIQLFLSLYGIKAKRAFIVEQILTASGLKSFGHRSLESLSKGQQSLLTLYASFAIPAQVYLIDEIADSLDEENGKRFISLITQTINQDKTVVLVSHSRSFKSLILDTMPKDAVQRRYLCEGKLLVPTAT